MIPVFDISITEQLAPVLFAALTGALLGIERDLHARPAGLRTSMMVCVGAYLYTTLSTDGFSGGDPTRVASQIVTGIGFIGGGVILKDEQKIQGLTTAAHIWLAAALGMAIGLEKYGLTVIVLVLALVILVVLRPISSRLDQLGTKMARRRGDSVVRED